MLYQPDVGGVGAEVGGSWFCSVDARHRVLDGDPGHLEEPIGQNGHGQVDQPRGIFGQICGKVVIAFAELSLKIKGSRSLPEVANR